MIRHMQCRHVIETKNKMLKFCLLSALSFFSYLPCIFSPICPIFCLLSALSFVFYLPFLLILLPLDAVPLMPTVIY